MGFDYHTKSRITFNFELRTSIDSSSPKNANQSYIKTWESINKPFFEINQMLLSTFQMAPCSFCHTIFKLTKFSNETYIGNDLWPTIIIY